MNSLQILIENIRRSMAFPETVPLDQRKGYATAYADMCKDLDRRMLESVRHIRNGNFAEGVRLAEIKPNILELYVLLDFAEREEWIKTVAQFGIDGQLSLPADMFKELNDAYLKISPLEPLLRMHRLHALNGAPLRERLAVLRAIAKIDQKNRFWQDDQKKFESARIKELGDDVQNAIETNSDKYIRLLLEELSMQEWLVVPPADLRKRLTESLLQNDAELLEEKFKIFDYDAAKTIYSSMEQALATAEMTMPPNVLQFIEPAVQWLDEETERKKRWYEFECCKEDIEDALEKETPLHKLQRYYYELTIAASRAGVTISEELEFLYKEKERELQRRRRMRNLLMFIGTTAACILIGLFFAAGWLEQESNKLAETIDNARVTENKEFLETLLESISEQWIAQYPDVKRAEADGWVWIKNENERVKNFEDAIHRAEEKIKEIENSGTHQAALDASREAKASIDKAKEYLNKRQQPQQREVVRASELEQKRIDAFEQYQMALDEEYRVKLAGFVDERIHMPTDSIDAFNDLEQRLRDFQNQSPHISSSLKLEGEREIQQIRKQIERIEILYSLFATIPDWNDYHLALRKFTTSFPNDPLAEDINTVLKEWNTVKEVADLLDKMVTTFSGNTHDFAALQNSSAALENWHKEISSKISGDLKMETVFPLANDIGKLSKIAPYTPDTLQSLKDFFGNFSMPAFTWVEGDRESGRWYYLTRQPTGSGPYQYVTSFLAQPKNYEIPPADWHLGKVARVTQHKFINDALNEKINRIGNNGDALTVVYPIIAGLRDREVPTEPGIDPIFQCIVLDLLISGLSKIDPFFEENFADIHRNIRVNLDPDLRNWMDVNWMDVDENNTRLHRARARLAINILPEDLRGIQQQIEEKIKKTREDRKRFEDNIKRFRPHFEWVAILTRTDGRWTLNPLPKFDNTESGGLFIFRQNTDNMTVRPVEVGKVIAGRVELQSDVLSPQFMPVFFVRHVDATPPAVPILPEVLK